MYVKGKVDYVDYVDYVDKDDFSVHEVSYMLLELGYSEKELIFYHFKVFDEDLNFSLRALGNNSDVIIRIEEICDDGDNDGKTVRSTQQILAKASRRLALEYNVGDSGISQVEDAGTSQVVDAGTSQTEVVLDAGINQGELDQSQVVNHGEENGNGDDDGDGDDEGDSEGSDYVAEGDGAGSENEDENLDSEPADIVEEKDDFDDSDNQVDEDNMISDVVVDMHDFKSYVDHVRDTISRTIIGKITE
ncbi:acidic leucine-rich nuclear phosphoprotein 32-related protein 1-like [Helianthus annuus]|uniref:acidic leucine-rich nuclear phosphoprotein 32-related protein 1-like n=1 Tax=Helianthus annuus TaxID=4232 RepID=UPI000B8F179F|nr:acidic leucine-rich nuclear phosphoprotein 32-related protein 1-like [Helianthus annuus]